MRGLGHDNMVLDKIYQSIMHSGRMSYAIIHIFVQNAHVDWSEGGEPKWSIVKKIVCITINKA